MNGQTQAPPLLTEADLITLMEKNGIGTDATHAEHIEKIKDRQYVGVQNDGTFLPGKLGKSPAVTLYIYLNLYIDGFLGGIYILCYMP